MRLRNKKNANITVKESKYVIINPKEQKGKWQEIFENEKEILDICLDLPFTYKVFNSLKSNGIEISKHLDSEGMVDELWQLHSEK